MDTAAPQSTSRDFSVLQQTVNFEIDFCNQSLQGYTEITIVPLSKDLRQVRLNCRQCNIKSVTVEGRVARFEYKDPYRRLRPHASWNVEQYHMLKDRLEPYFGDAALEELVIKLPRSVTVQESNSFASQPDSFFSRPSKSSGNAIAAVETPSVPVAEINASYAPMAIRIGFEIQHIRDGLHFVGLCGSDQRYPHAFTTNSPFAGSASSLFPCVDDPSERCHWDITIKCARTLGDALKIPLSSDQEDDVESQGEKGDPYLHNDYGLNEEERAYEMLVACSGSLIDEAPDSSDLSQKISKFACDVSVSANQIGFAVGPFTKVDLSLEFRESDDEEKTGDEALSISALCLPGRAAEVRNTAMPMARAADYFSTTFVTHPFQFYQICFVDDLPTDTVVTAALSFCSTRLLFSERVIDPIYDVTRKLVHSLAVQYAGIGVAPREPTDTWCVTGMAHFMADLFMKQLCGNNEYRYQQKLAADATFDMDHDRPSLYGLGATLPLDPSISEFMALKSNIVLFILDRRLAKSSGTIGMAKIIMRTLSNARSSFDAEGSLLSTAQFQRTCEKIGHCKLDTFFTQWVYGAGCPQFVVSQRFNKKKLVVEMQILQVHSDPERQMGRSKRLNPEYFLRDVNEESNDVYAAEVPNAFTGPMTIRIHEADGTPYEHIVDIKEQNTKIEIPYNTKYKRLKRSRRQKERAAANAGVDLSAEPQDDTLLYCLGDVLESEEEVAEWRLIDWTRDDEEKMSQESYEWIRMDADFEWICKMQIGMPAYMYVSQLQQDRDVVAQYDSLQWIASQQYHPLISTFLTRTIMDKRYFHGIRTTAASILPRCARSEINWIGLFHLEKIFDELFCSGDSQGAHPNDFSDRASYLVQCAIPKAMAKVRDRAGHAPMKVKRFLLSKLKFNDNGANQFADCLYVATLMSCLADTLVTSQEQGSQDVEVDDPVEEEQFQRDAIGEIERYRRFDEWIPSYLNIFSTTALDCLLRLTKSHLIHPKLADFLRYTQHLNADNVRLQAYRCLTELGGLRNGAIIKYFLRTLSNDVSPFMRKQIYACFGHGLGLAAIGEDKPEGKKAAEGGLIVEEGSTEARQAEIARKQTVAGAVAALRAEIGSMEALKAGLWEAITSPVTTLQDVWNLLTICELLIDPKDAMIVTLRYPRWWRCENLGDGKVRFYETGQIRLQPRARIAIPQSKPGEHAASDTVALPPPPPRRKPSMKINLGSIKGQAATSSAPATDTASITSTPAARATPKIMLSQSPAPQASRTTTPGHQSKLKRDFTTTSTPKDSRPSLKSRVVILKVPRLQDPVYRGHLARITPRPPATPATPTLADQPLSNYFPASSKGSGGVTMNVGHTTGQNIVSPSPTSNQESSSPTLLDQAGDALSPVNQRRQSSVASASTSASKTGTKRRSETPTTIKSSIETSNGSVDDGTEQLTKRRKSGASSSKHSHSATPAAFASTPAISNGLNESSGPTLNPMKRKTDVSVGIDNEMAASPNGQSQSKKRKNTTISTKRPQGGRKSLVLKLKVGKRLALLSNGDSAVNNRVDTSTVSMGGFSGHDATRESPDIPLAKAASSGYGQEARYAPVGEPIPLDATLECGGTGSNQMATSLTNAIPLESPYTASQDERKMDQARD